MTANYFNTLGYDEKLLLVEPDAPKLANFLTWSNPIKHITIYAVENFYAELVFDLSERKVEAINAFDVVDYLAKYRSFMAPVEGQIRGLKNEENPFDTL